tara:strand:+ start:377 stop:1405 length:1029 start_codon:yes stop_codon:yes gene_type:complete
MQIKVISNISDFKNLEEDWDTLFSTKNNYSTFQSFEFNYFSWKHDLSKSKNILSIVVLYEDNTIKSILPFYIDRRLRLRFINDLHADFCDCLTNIEINLNEVIKELQSKFIIRYFNLINLRTNSCILENQLPNYCKLISSSEYSILQLEKGVFPDNFSRYRSKQKTEFRRIKKINKDKKHEIIDCNISVFPVSDIQILRSEMIKLGLRDKIFLPSSQLLLIEELYNKGKIILSIVKTNNKINAISFVIKDSTQYLIWIDMFDESKMINIFNYILLISVLNSEESLRINFGRGDYRYKLLNFLPQSKDLFSLQIFSSKWQELKCNLERNIVQFLRVVYKIVKK